MRNRIQRAVMMGLLIAACVGAGACLTPLGKACGDGWCPDGYLCTPVDNICVKSGCGNAVSEAGEVCDDGNLDDGDECLSTCERNECGDGKVDLGAEECDDGNLDDEDDCLSTCKLNKCGDGKVHLGAEECDDGNTSNDDGCNNNCTISLSLYIKASNTGAGSSFGHSVALSADGSTLAVGAFEEDSAATGIGGNQTNNSAEGAGAVYVFTRSGMTWSQQAYVKASNTDPRDQFGYSVALSADGSTLAVGAIWESSAAAGIGGDQGDNSAMHAGAVYVFTRSGTTWSQQAYVKASNPDPGDQFGYSVALSADGSTLAVGAHGEGSAATGISGDQTDNSVGRAGAVYVFTRSGATWSQQAYVKASNTDPEDYFGAHVALSEDGSTLAVGAIGEASAAIGIGGNQDDDSAVRAGAVYVFTRSGPTWSQQAYVKASNTDPEDFFGIRVALSADGSTLAVGAHGEASAATGIGGDQADNSAYQAGAVYVFTRSGATWSQQAYVKASNTDPADYFGVHVALSEDGSTLAVGAIGEASAAVGIGGNQDDDSAVRAGAVYVFTRSGPTWSQRAYVKASNTDPEDFFGIRVALSADGSALAVGAEGEASAATGIGGNQTNNPAGHAGAVYVYPLPAQQSLSQQRL
jgi:trimeric autotransporter adhesin